MSQPCELSVAGLQHSHHSKPISTTLMIAKIVNTPMVVCAPFVSRTSAPAEGAKA
jgi:hypothetical protein